MVDAAARPDISAEPTKAFFVEMLTRDIPLEQAVLDLVDNSVDGAKRLSANGADAFEDRFVEIHFDTQQFRIFDNCGGFSAEEAARYAFRFGRPQGARATPHSIGQFGVGMKRALFKFGRHFIVHSATSDDQWTVEVNVDQWEAEEGWNFPWASSAPSSQISPAAPGTDIVVTNLRPEVQSKFSSPIFEREIVEMIRSDLPPVFGPSIMRVRLLPAA